MNEARKKTYTMLKTARGQIDSVIKMLEDDRYCVDISTQILATLGLLKKANLTILKQHMNSCVKESFEKGESEDKIEELMKLLDKYMV